MMYKSIVSVVGVAAGLVFTGCTTSTMMNDGGNGDRNIGSGGKYIELTPNVAITQTIADLEVSEQRVTGTAEGLVSVNATTAGLEKQAVANALAQKSGADVLVGASFYYNMFEKKTSSGDDGVSVKRYLTVTVVGYPARYKNFRTYWPKNYDGLDITADSSYTNVAAPNTVQNNTVPGVAPVVVPSVPVPLVPAPVLRLPTGTPGQ